jgi:hypothetical protein
VYLKVYLRLKFLGFYKHYVLLMFSCLICKDFVTHYIFFYLYGLVFCLDDLYGVFSGFTSFRSK